jgi:hypothetical protein
MEKNVNLNAAFNNALRSPQLLARFVEQSIEPLAERPILLANC